MYAEDDVYFITDILIFLFWKSEIFAIPGTNYLFRKTVALFYSFLFYIYFFLSYDFRKHTEYVENRFCLNIETLSPSTCMLFRWKFFCFVGTVLMMSNGVVTSLGSAPTKIGVLLFLVQSPLLSPSMFLHSFVFNGGIR